VRVLQTQKVISNQVVRQDGAIVEIRQSTEPNEQVKELYEALKLKENPIKRRKFVVHPAHPPNKKIIPLRQRKRG
uniref:hypothetical protein n=1 Tax=Bacteroides sp. UBA939 TaxID=1946092 RepID=UPI0025C22AAA